MNCFRNRVLPVLIGLAATAGYAADEAEKPSPVEARVAADQLLLDSTSIRGNRELPRVLYIVPWKEPHLGDVIGKPVNSLIDEVLAPVDRDVFLRQTRYFDQLYGSGRSGNED